MPLLGGCWTAPLVLGGRWDTPLLLGGRWDAPLLLGGRWYEPLLLGGRCDAPLLLGAGRWYEPCELGGWLPGAPAGWPVPKTLPECTPVPPGAGLAQPWLTRMTTWNRTPCHMERRSAWLRGGPRVTSGRYGRVVPARWLRISFACLQKSLTALTHKRGSRAFLILPARILTA